MNRREEDQYNQRDRQNRSDNNRQDDRRSDDSNYRGAYRFDDYRTVRDDYNFRPDNENNYRNRGQNYADERENRGRADQRNTQGGSNNYGNMGSYGGAQVFGSSRSGYSSQRHPEHRSGFDATSGHGPQGRDEDRQHPEPHRQIYGAYRDQNSYTQDERAANYRDRSEHDYQRRQPDRRTQDDDRNDDSRYEIYDSAQSQYNRGMYGNPTQGSQSRGTFQRTHIDDPRENYGSRQRPRFRQGSGNDQEHNVGNEMDYTNTAGSLSWGNDGQGGSSEPPLRHYDPRSGKAWEQAQSNRYRHPDERGYDR